MAAILLLMVTDLLFLTSLRYLQKPWRYSRSKYLISSFTIYMPSLPQKVLNNQRLRSGHGRKCFIQAGITNLFFLIKVDKEASYPAVISSITLGCRMYILKIKIMQSYWSEFIKTIYDGIFQILTESNATGLVHSYGRFFPSFTFEQSKIRADTLGCPIREPAKWWDVCGITRIWSSKSRCLYIMHELT